MKKINDEEKVETNETNTNMEDTKKYFASSMINTGDAEFCSIHMLNENIDIHIINRKVDDEGRYKLQVDSCDSFQQIYSNNSPFVVFESSYNISGTQNFQLSEENLLSIIKSILALHCISKEKVCDDKNKNVSVELDDKSKTLLVSKKLAKEAKQLAGGFISAENSDIPQSVLTSKYGSKYNLDKMLQAEYEAVSTFGQRAGC